MIITCVYSSRMKQGKSFDHVGFGNIHTKTTNVTYLPSFNTFPCTIAVMVSLLCLTLFDDFILFSKIHSYLQLVSLSSGRLSWNPSSTLDNL